MKFVKATQLLLLALVAVSVAYAEPSAPVFDVDSLSNDAPQQGDNPLKTTEGAPAITAVPITSATPSNPPLSTEQRLARLEQNAQSENANQVASMQAEVQALRGQVEELTHRLQELSSQQAAAPEAEQQLSKTPTEPVMSHLPRVADEDASPVTKHTTAKGKTLPQQHPAPKLAKAAPAQAVAAAQPKGAEEQAVYQSAYNLIKAKKYNEAIGTLQKMLAKYPSGQFAANAHYWLGELYSLTGQHEQAATEFSSVVKHYPANSRVADSQLKLGLIYATQLKWSEARSSFSRVVHQYPGSPSARLAMEQLKQLKQAGH